MTLINAIIIGFLVMLAVLGHSAWHGAETAIANFVVELFTGAHVTG